MQALLKSPRLAWALAYIGLNSVALLIILFSGELLGDLAGFKFSSAASISLTAGFLVFAVVALLFYYNALSRVKFVIKRVPHRPFAMGLIVACIQLAFILYVYRTGLFKAGSPERGGTFGSAFWVLLNADAIFLVYYAACRDSPIFKYNVILWVVSFTQRGWFAYLFFILAFESFRLFRRGKIGLRAATFALLLLGLYPLLDIAKVYIRLADVIEPSGMVQAVAQEVSAGEVDWKDMFGVSAEKIISRVQVLSHAQAIRDHQTHFHQLLETSELAPFWKEGIVGVVWDAISGRSHGHYVASSLATFIAPSLLSSWNVNPSLVGWLVAYEGAMPMTLIYLLSLCALSVFLGKLIGGGEEVFLRDAIWFIWLSFIVPGWIAQFVTFLVAMATYILIALLVQYAQSVVALGTRRMHQPGQSRSLV